MRFSTDMPRDLVGAVLGSVIAIREKRSQDAAVLLAELDWLGMVGAFSVLAGLFNTCLDALAEQQGKSAEEILGKVAYEVASSTGP